jgi:hypothetical protein
MSRPMPDQALGHNPSLAMNGRLGVASVDDSLKWDIPKPARRLAGDIGQPAPILVRVPVGLAVGLDEVAGRDQRIVKASPMNVTLLTDGAIKLLGEPFAIAVTRCGVEPVRIHLRGQHGEIAESTPGFLARGLKDRAQDSVSVDACIFGSWNYNHVMLPVALRPGE